MGQMKKDVHLSGTDLMAMVQLRAEDVGDYVLVPGPVERMQAIVKKLENPVKNFSFMEYTMMTGMYQGVRISTINGGRFSADTAITTEILCCAKAKTMIRLGSCGALKEDIAIGDVVVADSALRGDGVTPYYVDKDFQPRADDELTRSLEETLKGGPCRVHRGCCWSTDAILRETREVVGRAVEQGAVAVDMVSSTFLTLCQLYKVSAAVVLAVSDNVMTGEMGFMNPAYYMAESQMIDKVLEFIAQREGKRQRV